MRASTGQDGAMTELHHVAAGPIDAPAVLFGSSLGTDHRMWSQVAEDLAAQYRVISFDWRGHGQSPVPPGPYRVGDLVGDVVHLADRLGLDSFAYVGLSLGGFVGQALAARHPDRVTALVACCTSAWFGDPAPWHERAARVRAEKSTRWLREGLTERWFTPEFTRSDPAAVEFLLDMVEQTPPEGYAACAEAIAGTDLRPELAAVTAPTLVISGDRDPVSPPAAGAEIVAGIQGARHEVLTGTSHMAQVMAPRQLSELIATFLAATLT